MQTHKLVPALLLGGLLGGLTGCQLLNIMTPPPPPMTLHVFEESTIPAEVSGSFARQIQIPGTDLSLAINSGVMLDELDLTAIEYRPTNGRPAIFLQFDDHGTLLLTQLTVQGQGRYLVFCLNDKPITAWRVDRRITNGQFLMTGPTLTAAEATNAINLLMKQVKKNNAP